MGLRFVSEASAQICSLLKAENISYPGKHLCCYAFICPSIYPTVFSTAAYEQKLVPLNGLLICFDDSR